MSQKGKIQLTFIIISPADHVAEGDRLLEVDPETWTAA